VSLHEDEPRRAVAKLRELVGAPSGMNWAQHHPSTEGMTVSLQEDEHRYTVAKLRELVGAPCATNRAQNDPPNNFAPRVEPELSELPLRRSSYRLRPEDDPLVNLSDLVAGQEHPEKLVVGTQARRSTPQEALVSIERRAPHASNPKRDLRSNFVEVVASLTSKSREAAAVVSKAARPDRFHDRHGELKNPHYEREKDSFNFLGLTDIESTSRRYLLAMAITIVLGLGGIGASLLFQSSISDLAETLGPNVEMAKLQPGESADDAPAQDAPAVETSPQASQPMSVYKAERSADGSRAQENAPPVITPGSESGSAMQPARTPAPTRQMQTKTDSSNKAAPLWTMAALRLPTLQADSFSTNNAPSLPRSTVAPAKPEAKRSSGGLGPIAKQTKKPTRPISPTITGSAPHSVAKQASLPPSRPSTAALTAPPAKANTAESNPKTEGGRP
jgi:hypothetical protein